MHITVPIGGRTVIHCYRAGTALLRAGLSLFRRSVLPDGRIADSSGKGLIDDVNLRATPRIDRDKNIVGPVMGAEQGNVRFRGAASSRGKAPSAAGYVNLV
jgi:hypothetical protein